MPFNLDDLIRTIEQEKQEEYAAYGDARIEEGILTSVMQSRTKLVTARSLISDQTFSIELYRSIWKSICALADDNLAIDYATILTRLRDVHRIKVDEKTEKIVQRLWQIDSDGLDLETYCSIADESAKKRRCGAIGEGLQRLSKSKQKSIEIVQTIQRDLSALVLANRERTDKTVGQIISENPQGLAGVLVPYIGQSRNQTPVASCNELFDGYFPKKLYYVGARSSHGKTAWAVQQLVYSAAQKVRSTYFSREMTKESILRRAILQRMVSLNRYELREAYENGLKQEALDEARSIADWLDTLPLTVSDLGGRTVEGLRLEIESLVYKDGVQLVIVDHMQHIGTTRDFRGNIVTETGYISNRLREIADDFGISLIVLSQIIKEAAKRPDKRPMLADLPNSLLMEADAEAVQFLHRPGMYDSKIPLSVVEWILAKQREGEVGTRTIEFDMRTLAFKDKEVVPPFSFATAIGTEERTND